MLSQDFLSKIFCLTVPKNFVEDPFSFSIISGTKNFRDKCEGDSRFSVENFLSHTGEKFHRGTFSCCVPERF